MMEGNKMTKSVRALTALKGINGVLEIVLGFPFIAGLSVITHEWGPLVVMFFLHMVALLLAIVMKSSYKTGSLVGLLASLVGYVPFIGMLLHISAAFVNLSEGYQLFRGKRE
jgi:hypothetical protein